MHGLNRTKTNNTRKSPSLSTSHLHLAVQFQNGHFGKNAIENYYEVIHKILPSKPKEASFRLLGTNLSNDFSWTSYIECAATSAVRKAGSLLRCKGFVTHETFLYLYKSTIRSCIEYCCHLRAGAPASCLSLLDRIQQRICNVVGPNFLGKLDSLSHSRNVPSLSLFY